MFISESLTVNEKGNLAIGRCDVPALCKQYGTPVYLMDEGYIEKACRTYVESLRKYYGKNTAAAYASKAFSAVEIYRLLDREGMYADVVSGGELYTAMQAGFPAQRIYFHGNNKTPDELKYALACGVGMIIVDNRDELWQLDSIAGEAGARARISFRIKPGIDAHTHDFIQTGRIDSKFGVALENNEAFEIIRDAIAMKNVEVAGIHCHIGSQIFELAPFELAAEVMVRLMGEVADKLGYRIGELNLGGGFGIKYIASHDPYPIGECMKAAAEAVKKACAKYGVALPKLSVEPGRSIVGPAGITVYTVGSVKEIKNIRRYVSIDGGMTDNPRYALYEAVYEALLPTRPLAEKTTPYTVAGRCCESGDLIGKDIMLPEVKAGDLLCVLSTGAYNYTMSSNYNRIPRPPVVFVKDGSSRVVVKREDYADLLRNDL